MLKVAQRYNMSFAPIKLSQHLKKQLPAWLHLGAPPKTYLKSRDSYLQRTHAIRSVKDIMKLNYRPINNWNHRPKKDCACDPCIIDRLAGCKNPHRCIQSASAILTKITPKFSPLNTPPADNLTLTHCCIEKNTRAISQHQGDIVFDPSVTAKSSLTECFRIFNNTKNSTQQPAHCLQRPGRGRGTQERSIEIFTDGSCLNNGKENARCGSGIWLGENNNQNKALRVPGSPQSNQAGELAAILLGIQTISPLTPAVIITDS
ncbi:hypothetical protein BDR03DRAFT_864415 [Suillus americanus]|nr:hypothetical protein BDR03DRAFT_864415 [Suillus americanus]